VIIHFQLFQIIRGKIKGFARAIKALPAGNVKARYSTARKPGFQKGIFFLKV
jgi:hypothetical protein